MTTPVISALSIKFPASRKQGTPLPLLGANEEITDYCVAAAQEVLEKRNMDPSRIGLVIYGGSGNGLRQHWSSAAKIQYLSGATNAYTLDVLNMCNSFNTCLRIAIDRLNADQQTEAVLIAFGDDLGRWVDHEDSEPKCISFFADSASAILLERTKAGLAVKAQNFVTDGRFFQDLHLDPKTSRYRLETTPALDQSLSDAYEKHYTELIQRTAAKSSTQVSALKAILMNQGSPSLISRVERNLGLTQGFIFRSHFEYGHAGNGDVVWGLLKTIPALNPGDRVAVVNSGIGYSWSCSIMEKNEA